MDKIYNDFAKKYIRVYNEKTHPIYLLTDKNYANDIGTYKSFLEAYNFYHGKIDRENDMEFILYAFIKNRPNILFTTKEKDDIEKTLNFTKEFNSSIIELKNKYDLLTKNYISIGETILSIENDLEKIESINYEIKDKYHTLNYKITYKNRELIADDSLMIFNLTLTSKNIPIIIYTNNKGKKYTKILKHSIIDDNFVDKIFPDNSVVFVIKNQYIIINTDMSNCSVKININRAENNIKNWLTSFFPYEILFPYLSFEISNKQDKIIGNISFDTEINSYDLYKLILLDPWMSFFFYIEENTTPWAARSLKYIIRFKDYNESIIMPSIYTKTYMPEFNKYNTMPDVTIKVPVNNNEKEIGLSFDFDAENNFDINNFAYKFSKLISKYIKTKKIPNTKGTSLGSSKFKIYTKSSDELKNQAPELFAHVKKVKTHEREIQAGKYYFSKCQIPKQPILIEENEIEDWKKYDRQIAEFPPAHIPTEKRYYFVCPLDEYKYVQLIENTQTIGDNKFPYLPCCQKTKVTYNKLPEYINYNNSKINDLTGKSNRSIISDAILNKNSEGEFDSFFSSFLNQEFSDDKNVFKRYGVSDSLSDPNSFINAIYYANYNKYHDPMHIRKILAGKIPNPQNDSYINVNIYKQELYDYDDEKIISELLDPTVFIDPYLFYRGLEELFGVNIYVFAKNQDLKTSYPISIEQKNSPYPILEIPRCRYMSIRNNNNLPVILIYKSYGNNKTKNAIPNCELIFCSLQKQKIFKFNFNKYIYKYYKQITYPLEWQKNEHSKDIDCYGDPFDTKWMDIIPEDILGKILGQEIDGYGKTVSLIFKEWTISIPQTQPLNLPTLVRPPLKTVCEVHQTFDTTSFLTDIDGIWIPYNGNSKGIKIYCDMGMDKSNWDLSNSIELLINNKNKVSLLMQIINYLWRSDHFPIFEEWLMKNSEVDNSIIFDNVPSSKISCNNRMFPEGNTFNERINKIASWWPFFFYRSKIHLSKKLFDRILNYFKREEILTSGLDNKITATPRFVTDLIFTKTDFKSYNDLIFDNNDSLKEWIFFTQGKKYLNQSMNNMNIIHTTIDIRFKDLKEPFLFKNSTGKIYIIQNVLNKFQVRHIPALQVAVYWNDNNKNIGSDYFDNDISKYENEKYVIYSFDEISVVNDSSKGSSEYFELISYGGDGYAAMLPIL